MSVTIKNFKAMDKKERCLVFDNYVIFRDIVTPIDGKFILSVIMDIGDFKTEDLGYKFIIDVHIQESITADIDYYNVWSFDVECLFRYYAFYKALRMCEILNKLDPDALKKVKLRGSDIDIPLGYIGKFSNRILDFHYNLFDYITESYSEYSEEISSAEDRIYGDIDDYLQ